MVQCMGYDTIQIGGEKLDACLYCVGSLSLSLSFEQKSKERERERERVFVWKKYGLIEINDIKFIQNKMERKRVKI